MTHTTEATDDVRRLERWLLIIEGENRLNRTKHLWISFKEEAQRSPRAAVNYRRGADAKAARASAIKGSLRQRRSFLIEAWDGPLFSESLGWAIRSRLPVIKGVQRTIERRPDKIFTRYRNQVPKAVAEHPNSRSIAINPADGPLLERRTLQDGYRFLRRPLIALLIQIHSERSTYLRSQHPHPAHASD